MAESEATIAVEDLPPLVGITRNALFPGRGIVCRVDESSISSALRYAAALSLIPNKIDGILQPKLEAALSRKRVTMTEVAGFEGNPGPLIRAAESSLINATKSLGTHGGKIPDARISIGAIVPDVDVVKLNVTTQGMHSGTVGSRHPMSGSGNAAESAKLRFLCLPISFSSEPTQTLAQVLSRDCAARSAIFSELDTHTVAALLRIGVACAKRFFGGETGIPANVEPYSSQVFFPTGAGYVAISPLYPLCLGAELVARLKERQRCEDENDRQKFSTRIAHVGGTKPSNAGLLATYIGGEFPRLIAMPPREFSVDSIITTKKFSRGGVGLSDGKVGATSFADFASAYYAHDMMPNVKTRATLDSAVGAMCLDVMASLVAVAKENEMSLVLTGKHLLDDADIPSRSRDIAMILGMTGVGYGADDFSRMSHAVGDKVGSRLHGRDFPTRNGAETFVVDDRVADWLSAVAGQMIEEFV